MFHLLPEKEKKILQTEYHYHLFFVCLIFVLGSLVVASIFLLPSYLLSARKLTDISAGNEITKKEIATKTDPAAASFLSSLRDNLKALQPTQNAPSFSALIREITDKKTNGISINQISWSGQDIIIGGMADNRDDLTRFSRDLQTVKDFSKIDLPISDFAKNKDIDFSITITLKKND